MAADSYATTLEPCPCCGGEARFDMVQNDDSGNYGGWYIECTKCLLTTRLVFPMKGDVQRELAETWNRRPPSPPESCRDAVIEELAQLADRERDGIEHGVGKAQWHLVGAWLRALKHSPSATGGRS